MNVETLAADPYAGYAYAYPHKTAYRRLDPPVPLRDAWRDEDRSALSLYVHVPVCEMRCGFCNLFTTVGVDDDFESAYLAKLETQSKRVARALGEAAFTSAAIGGGTPTFLSTHALGRVLALMEALGGAASTAPTSVETSPRTADDEKLALLRAAGVQRISIGVQSFVEAECRALGRPQKTEWVVGALERIRAHGFPTLNVDLMYGIDGQDAASWTRSIEQALAFRPEELFLYPLYVRPLTGIAKRATVKPTDGRVALYRAGRDLLIGAGYRQVSMRLFRREGVPALADTCCQEDGMVGLGVGARSYTRALHFGWDWATGARGVRSILDDYLRAPDAAFDVASYGVRLAIDEQRRRYVIKTLLRSPGLSLAEYRAWFGTCALADLPELRALERGGLVERIPAPQGDRFTLTKTGFELSDAIGPALYSPAARARMTEFELR